MTNVEIESLPTKLVKRAKLVHVTAQFRTWSGKESRPVIAETMNFFEQRLSRAKKILDIEVAENDEKFRRMAELEEQESDFPIRMNRLSSQKDD